MAALNILVLGGLFIIANRRLHGARPEAEVLPDPFAHDIATHTHQLQLAAALLGSVSSTSSRNYMLNGGRTPPHFLVLSDPAVDGGLPAVREAFLRRQSKGVALLLSVDLRLSSEACLEPAANLSTFERSSHTSLNFPHHLHLIT